MTNRRSSHAALLAEPREQLGPHPNRTLMASTQQRRPLGILAFLPAEGEHYPYREDCWKEKMGARRGASGLKTSTSRERRRRRRRQEQEQPPRSEESSSPDRESISTTVALVDWFHDASECDSGSDGTCAERKSRDWKDDAGDGRAAARLLAPRENADPSILVLFCFDPGQPYSCTVRNRLLSLYGCALRGNGADSCGARDSSARVRCVAVSTRHRSPEASDFLRNTGFVAVPWTAQLASLGVVPPHTPSLAVYRGQKKVSCSHEELGLEWNSADRVLRRWRDGLSSLSCPQRALAGVVFPASCAVL